MNDTEVIDERAPLLGGQTTTKYDGTTVHYVEASGSTTPGGTVVANDAEGNDDGDVEDVRKDDLERPSVSMVTVVPPLALGIFLVAMDVTVVVSSYAAIGSEFEQLQKTSWIATGYLLTLTSFQPLYGKLSDIFGRKPCLLFAYVMFALGNLFCGLARNMTELVIARALAGLGGGGMSTVTSILLSDVVPLRSRGTWQGIINIVFASGQATGAPLGGILADGISWRSAFLIQVPATCLAMFSVIFFLNPPAPRVKVSGAATPTTEAHISVWTKLRRIDWTGAFLLVSAVLCLLLALDQGAQTAPEPEASSNSASILARSLSSSRAVTASSTSSTWTSPLTLSLLFSSILLLIIFVFVEAKHASNPFAPPRILFSPSLLPAFLCNLLGIASSISLVFHVPLFAQAVFHSSARSAGLLLLPSIVAGVMGSLGGGLWMQRTGKFWGVTVWAYVMLLLGSIALTVWLKMGGGFVGMAIWTFVSSIGNGTGITTTLIALIANAAPEDQAVATAISYLFRSMGSVIGISVGSTLVQDHLRSYLTERLSDTGVDVDELVTRVRTSLSTIDTLDPAIQSIVRDSYAQAILWAFYWAVGLAVAASVCSWFIKEKELRR